MHAVLLTLSMLLLPSTGRESIVLDRLEGEWRIESWVQGGVDVFARANGGVPANRWVFRQSIMSIYADERAVVGDLKIALNENANPITFMLTYVGSDEALKQRYKDGVRGICRFDGDVWTRCYHTDWKQMPEKFESPAGSGFILQTFRRVKSPALRAEDPK